MGVLDSSSFNSSLGEVTMMAMLHDSDGCIAEYFIAERSCTL